jgi:uncharacterized membrane protein
MDDAIWATVEYLREIFVVVLALAVCDAFAQLVAHQDDESRKRTIRTEAVVGLVAFLFLLFPFYHGMARYLYNTYRIAETRPQPYSRYLLADAACFTIEAGFFFVMARSLRHEQWRRFYATVVGILIVDILWGILAWQTHSPEVVPWLTLNIVAVPVFLGLLKFIKEEQSWLASGLGLGLMILRTTLDYLLSWGLYFPS